jgi:hypothetical protein
MANYGFGSLTLERAVSFLAELSRGAWEREDISKLITTQPTDERELPGIFLFLKLDLYQTITAASQIAGSDLSVLLKKGDSIVDNLQARLEARLKLASLEGDEETQRVVTRCEEKLVIPGIRQMSYQDEITNARLQITLATQDAPAGQRPLRDDVAQLGLTSFFKELEREVNSFEALQQQSELPPSLRIQSALRECTRALNNAYETLQRLQHYTPTHSPLAQSLEQRLTPFDALLERINKPTTRTPTTKTEAGKD